MSNRKDALIAAAKEKKRKRLADAEAAAEAQFQKELEAIELVLQLEVEEEAEPANWSESATRWPGIPTAADRHQPGFFGDTWPGRAAAVKRAVAAQTGEFDLDGIMDWIENRFPGKVEDRIVVSRELWRLKERGAIRVEKPGAGKRSAIYRVAKVEP